MVVYLYRMIPPLNIRIPLDVKLINSIKIPPRESCTIQAKVELSSADTVYFQPAEPTQLAKPILLSPSLLHINNYTTHLNLYNPLDTTQTLYMNTLLGHVTHTPHNVPSFQLFDTPKCLRSNNYQPSLNNIILPPPLSSTISNTVDKLLAHITNTKNKNDLHLILQNYLALFDTTIITQANTPIQRTIQTGEHLPISSRPYPRTNIQRRELQEEIQKMLHLNQIRPSTSPWSSPVIIHKKKMVVSVF